MSKKAFVYIGESYSFEHKEFTTTGKLVGLNGGGDSFFVEGQGLWQKISVGGMWFDPDEVTVVGQGRGIDDPIDASSTVKPNDGGPAFPCDSQKQYPTQEGMSLRAWYAGKVLSSFSHCTTHNDSYMRKMAEYSAKMADMMIAELEKNGEKS